MKPEDQWDDLRKQLGDRVTSVVVEGASHALFPEQPVAVADEVIGYLRTLV
jgi:pimeloyl-ACP methyl ester carboxylesterase